MFFSQHSVSLEDMIQSVFAALKDAASIKVVYQLLFAYVFGSSKSSRFSQLQNVITTLLVLALWGSFIAGITP